VRSVRTLPDLRRLPRLGAPEPDGVIRLSSNENPYGPPPAAFDAMRRAFDLVWRYPDEAADELAADLARLHGVGASRCSWATDRARFSSSVPPPSPVRAGPWSWPIRRSRPSAATLNRETRDWTTAAWPIGATALSPPRTNFLMIDIRRGVGPLIDALRQRKVHVGRRFAALPSHLRVTVGTRPRWSASWRPWPSCWRDRPDFGERFEQVVAARPGVQCRRTAAAEETKMSDDQKPFITLPTDEEMRAIRERSGARPTYNFGFIGGMSRLLVAHERIGKAMGAAFYEMMFAPGALSRAEREMLAAVASAAQDCEY
jgi:Carboxymuconolactone decarboxylase family